MGFAALRMSEEVNQDSSDWDRYGSCPQEQYRIGAVTLTVTCLQVFLSHGAALRQAHLSYWGNHPRAVCVLEKHRCQLFLFYPAGLFV